MFGGLRKFRADYGVIPHATFTEPEVARVGLNEEEARAQGIAYEVTRYDLADLDRAIAEREARGLVKVLTAPGKDKILGACIAGEQAGELIGEFTAAMRHGLGLNQILGTIHIYPTSARPTSTRPARGSAPMPRRPCSPSWSAFVPRARREGRVRGEPCGPPLP